MSLITEEQVELQSIEWFKELGYQYKDGYDIAPEGVNSERDDFRQVILEERERQKLLKINAMEKEKNEIQKRLRLEREIVLRTKVEELKDEIKLEKERKKDLYLLRILVLLFHLDYMKILSARN